LLDGIKEKIKDKNTQINQKQTQVNGLQDALARANNEIEELKELIKKYKKKNSGDNSKLNDQLRSKESEMEVLKEMIRGIKLQLKSKDTDI